LRSIAMVIRSKNAGPFEITLDVIFSSREDYEAVKRANVITRELIAKLYHVATGHAESVYSVAVFAGRQDGLVRRPRWHRQGLGPRASPRDPRPQGT
jgi:hypothetical protein